MHDQGRCSAPTCHEPYSAQAAFVRDSTWGDDWREQASKFLALYFGDDPGRYFSPDAEGKPRRTDPDGLYSETRNVDWRTWTIEIQAYEDVRLFDLARTGQIRHWGLNPKLRNYMNDLAIDSGDLYERFPLLAQLPEDREVRGDDTDAESVFDRIDRLVRAEVLP